MHFTIDIIIRVSNNFLYSVTLTCDILTSVTLSLCSCFHFHTLTTIFHKLLNFYVWMITNVIFSLNKTKFLLFIIIACKDVQQKIQKICKSTNFSEITNFIQSEMCRVNFVLHCILGEGLQQVVNNQYFLLTELLVKCIYNFLCHSQQRFC